MVGEQRRGEESRAEQSGGYECREQCAEQGRGRVHGGRSGGEVREAGVVDGARRGKGSRG